MKQREERTVESLKHIFDWNRLLLLAHPLPIQGLPWEISSKEL